MSSEKDRNVYRSLFSSIDGLRPTYYGFTSRANVIPSPAPTNADSPQGSIAYGIILTDIFQNRTIPPHYYNSVPKGPITNM
ncbi:hypothetical protein YC2023_109173 [Brassica napus]